MLPLWSIAAERAESRLVVYVEESSESIFGDTGTLADETFDQVAANEEFSQFQRTRRRSDLRGTQFRHE